MVKNIIAGITVGIANVIPGVSGGTMMVILGIFEKMMEVIARITKPQNPHLKSDLLFLAQVLAGVGLGVVGFAKILEFLFFSYPTPTIWWFIGLITCSIPLYLNTEMKGKKFFLPAFLAGLALIFGLEFFNPGSTEVETNVVFPMVTITHLAMMFVVGIIGGASMLMPGVSGSLVLLIIGQYYLFKSYIANVTSFQLDVLVSLGFIGVGVLVGIFGSSKLCAYLIEKHEHGFLSFILGLICGSAVILVPFGQAYSWPLALASGVAFIFGGIIIFSLAKLK